jgi:hypothetical protein
MVKNRQKQYKFVKTGKKKSKIDQTWLQPDQKSQKLVKSGQKLVESDYILVTLVKNS